jgi:hypothetical protein
MHRNSAKTHCLRGHEFTPENTYYTPHGSRHCRTCTGHLPKKAKTHCKRGHPRTPENVDSHGACKICKPELKRVWLEKNPDHDSRAADHKKQGWTTDLIEKVRIEQNGLCAVCKNVLTRGKITGSRECLDHEHTASSIPPVPRGILCSNCNIAIGLLQDNSSVVDSAANYLRKFGK